MYQFEKIKLIIWDLDETLWRGTLSEGEVYLPEQHRKLLQSLTDIGIINSICSKNDLESVKQYLEAAGLWELFVFPSVNWQAKGQRVKQQIQDMQLRAENVLFLDDNVSNLNEALFYCPKLMTAGPQVIPELINETETCSKDDMAHKRLTQYKILEKKYTQKALCASNEEFLMKSGIKLTMAEDCAAQLPRIHDLVWRSNQLNFTKVRASREELAALFDDPKVQCGYVMVTDRFGDYGIVGFYALKAGRLLHFCFSCRTLGMGIEQYVYNYLKRPQLDTVGEVVSDLSSTELPPWINQEHSGHEEVRIAPTASGETGSVLLKGPCDLFQILPYIAEKDRIETEFTYVAPNGTVIESTGHTTHIVEALRLNDRQKKRVIEEVPFLDAGIYRYDIYKKDYQVVIVSILSDANLGVYRHKVTKERFAFAEGFYPITDPENWDGYISGKYNGCSVTFTRELLAQISETYEFVGINTPEQIVENLRYIKSRLPKDCTLAVMLGGELYYEKNTFPAYETRHLTHKAINDAIRASADEIGLALIDVNRYLVDQSSFYDHFNHYIKPVYYALAQEIVELINIQTGQKFHKTSRYTMLLVRMKEFLAPYYYRLRKLFA